MPNPDGEGKTEEARISQEARIKAKAEKDTGGRSDGGRFRPNSTSSIYISSTLSVPDNDEIMLSVGTVLQCIILQGEGSEGKNEDTPKKVKEKFDLFDERIYCTSTRSATEKAAPVKVEDIFDFLQKVFNLAQFSPECNTISLVLINRLLNFTKMGLHSNNWRPLVLCSLLVAQKIWDDRCLANVDFPVIWRCAVPQADAQTLDLKAVNLMEVNYLELLQYNVYVSGSLYAKYYFELRTLHESNSATSFALKPLTRAQASRLEARSAASRTSLENQGNKKKASSFMSGAQGSSARAVIS